ncbi:MAG: hypothetical protein WCO13_12620 [Bacteroidota bacterium]
MKNFKNRLVNEAERISQKEGLKDLIDLGIISINELQKYVVKELYFEEKKKGEKTCKDIKIKLSEDYAISYNKIEKIIY